MDHLEEQENEIEALKAIYTDEELICIHFY